MRSPRIKLKGIIRYSRRSKHIEVINRTLNHPVQVRRFLSVALDQETVNPAVLPTKGVMSPISGFESPKYENL